jgi:hypothetical protein
MWTIEKFKEVNNRYESSGLSAKDFCCNERITRSRFYYWRKQYRKLFKPGVYVPKVADKKMGRMEQASGFIPLVLSSGVVEKSFSLHGKGKMSQATTPPASSGAFMEVSYQNGTSIRLFGEKDMELVKTLIHLSR